MSVQRKCSENFDVFNSRDDIYLAFTEKRSNFCLFILYLLEELRSII